MMAVYGGCLCHSHNSWGVCWPWDGASFVIFEIIWDQNPFNFSFKNSAMFEYDYKYNYVVIVGGLEGIYGGWFYPFLFCDLKPQRR